jgi:hypothetical protein
MKSGRPPIDTILKDVIVSCVYCPLKLHRRNGCMASCSGHATIYIARGVDRPTT